MAFKIGDNTVIDDNRALTAVGVTAATNLNIPSGNTAGRPTGAVGKLYFDTDLGKLLVYDGTAWIVAGSTGFDLSAHDTSYSTGKLIMGAGETGIFIYYMPFNEAVNYFVLTHQTTGGSNYWDCYVKFRDMPHLCQMTDQKENADSFSWPDHVNGHSAAYKFLRHASLSLDNTAVAFNTGGYGGTGGSRGAAWIFDSKYPGSGFVIESTSSSQTSNACNGIYKFSDTQYVTFIVGVHTNITSTPGNDNLYLRCYNPTQVTEGNRNDEGDAYPEWAHSYQASQGTDNNYMHTMRRASWGGVWKSATAGQLTVLYVNNGGHNESIGNHPDFQGSLGNAGWKIAIFDINMTTGQPVAGSELYFEPYQHNMPSTLNFSVCECSTHVTFITWPEANNQPQSRYCFWIFDKTNRDLRQFRPETGDGSYYNHGFNTGSNSMNIWMWHFKMNDKIYCCVSEQESVGSAYRRTNMYETTATGATKYMYIQTQGNSPTEAPEGQEFTMHMIPQHGTDSFQFTMKQENFDGLSYGWEGENGSYEGTSNNGSLNYFTVTTKPEVSKTSLGANFSGLASGAWTGTAPTMTLNPEKVTSNVPTWSVLNSDSTVTGTNNQTGWNLNMMRKTFYEGKKYGNE